MVCYQKQSYYWLQRCWWKWLRLDVLFCYCSFFQPLKINILFFIVENTRRTSICIQHIVFDDLFWEYELFMRGECLGNIRFGVAPGARLQWRIIMQWQSPHIIIATLNKDYLVHIQRTKREFMLNLLYVRVISQSGYSEMLFFWQIFNGWSPCLMIQMT